MDLDWGLLLCLNITMAVRQRLPNHSITLEGGGAAPLCINVTIVSPRGNRYQAWFGNANPTWNATAMTESGEVVHDNEDVVVGLESHVSTDCPDTELIGMGIAQAVKRFEAGVSSTPYVE